MLQFKLFGIPVSIHWMFWLLAAFLGGAIGANSPQDMLFVVIFMVAAFISILAHEFGHALTGLRLGASSAAIQLHALGGMAYFNNARFTRGQSILMTAAGPGASLLLAGVCYAIALVFITGPADPAAGIPVFRAFLGVMITINLFWTAINILPVLPLDGGRILADILGPERIKITCIVSFATLAILTVLLWMSTRSLFNMVIMFLLGSHTWQVFKAANNRSS